MLKQYSEQEIEERYQKLPEELQAAMYDFDVADKTFQLGKKHGLSTDKIGLMAEILGYVVLGFIGPREFVKTLSEELRVGMEKAKALASEINATLFAPLRGMLKRTHDVEFTEEEIQRGGEELVRKPSPEKRPDTKYEIRDTKPQTPPPAPKQELKPAQPQPQILESKPTFPGITPVPKTSTIDLTPRPVESAKIPKPEEKPSNTTSAVPTAVGTKTNVADVDILGKPEVPAPPPPSQPLSKSDFNKPAQLPSWITKEQTHTMSQPPQAPLSKSDFNRAEPKIELTPAPAQTEPKKEPELIPPPPRLGPRTPPIDLRNAPIPTKPASPNYKANDPYKESLE